MSAENFPNSNSNEAEPAVKIVPVEEIIENIKPQNAEPLNLKGISHGYPDRIIGLLMGEIREHPELINLLKEFNGQIVVDLGAGDRNGGYRVVSLAGAKSYIGVEPNYAEELQSDISEYGAGIKAKELSNVDINPIPVAVVEEDALSFLKRLPDKSVSIFSSGTDGNVIRKDEYIDAVIEEIKRVLHPEGAFINNDSAFMMDEEESYKDFTMRYRDHVGGQKINMPLLVYRWRTEKDDNRFLQP